MDIAHHADHNAAEHGVPLEYSSEEGSLKILGFWMFLCSDLILFSCLFAMYIVLQTNTDNGPTELQLFDINTFTAETVILLTSSFTCGLGTYSMRKGSRAGLMAWLVVTVLLGLSFVGLEIREFVDYATHGAPISRSGFLSGFFTLVGTHGCHVSLGILWMCSIIYQLARHGITAFTARKVFIVGLYWHFLDVVWVFIFSVVYLPGVMK